MLFGELAPLISAMHNRTNQPKLVNADDVEEQESLFQKCDEEELLCLPREFSAENHFPVLMLSYLGPQHGRLFYACMNGKELTIRQSRLYSFESEQIAPIAFFTRMLLSSPLT